jgi:hypothetical protein
MEIKIKYGYYNLLPEKLVIICCDDPKEWCKKYKPFVNYCSELLKRINRIVCTDWDYETDTPIYTEWK